VPGFLRHTRTWLRAPSSGTLDGCTSRCPGERDASERPRLLLAAPLALALPITAAVDALGGLWRYGAVTRSMVAWVVLGTAWTCFALLTSFALQRPRRDLRVRVWATTPIVSLRIPRSCLGPCLLSAPLFFAIHAGTSDGELWLAGPAGVLFAWLAYRTGGPTLPALLHLSVSVVAALVVSSSA
jgi:hypothetical protein